jgi:hypothetical protein
MTASLAACDREAARQRELEAQLETLRDEGTLPSSLRARPDALPGAPRLLVTQGHLVVAGDGPMHSRALALRAPDWADGLRSRLSGAGTLAVQAYVNADARVVQQSVDIAREVGFDAVHVLLEGPGGPAALTLSDLGECAAPADTSPPRQTCEACPAALNDALEPADGLCAFPTFVWSADGVHLRLDPARDAACAPALGAIEAPEGRPASPMGAWVTVEGSDCPAAAEGALAALRAADASARLCTSAALAVPVGAAWGDVARVADALVHELAFERVALVGGEGAGEASCGSSYVFEGL